MIFMYYIDVRMQMGTQIPILADTTANLKRFGCEVA
jgi:hypothetical protein